MSKVWVEIDPETLLAIRIFKNHKLMVMAMPYVEDGPTKQMDRSLAVKQIREQVFARQKQQCANCPTLIRWDTMELHERQHRGQFAKQDVNNPLEVEKSGEISTMNSEGLCWSCHHLVKHGGRQPRLKNV